LERESGRRLQDFTAAHSFGLKFQIPEMQMAGLKGLKIAGVRPNE
jgi:hypothetical protein